MPSPPKVLRYLKRRRDKNRKAVAEIKLARGCENPLCPWAGPYTAEMLEFDHIDPATKLFKVADLQHKAWPVILAEMAKCRVLCANCHRAVTFPPA